MNKEIEKIDVKWYDKLIFELKGLEFTGIVITKWHIGKRLKEEENKFGKAKFGSKRIENIAKDLDTSPRELWRCIQLFEKCRTATQLKAELENRSWNWITNKYLPEPKLIEKPQIELPKGKYSIIYADPPWQYYEGGFKNQSQHYETMTIDKLAELDIENLSADDCILFLWATFPILPEALELMHQWGFSYSTIGFNWIKSNKNGKGFFFGLGNWTRSNSELCLIGTKGSPARQSASVSQIIYEPIGKHSEKPAIVRDKIVELIGDLPRIELFARQKVKGWDNWGLEI